MHSARDVTGVLDHAARAAEHGPTGARTCTADERPVRPAFVQARPREAARDCSPGAEHPAWLPGYLGSRRPPRPPETRGGPTAPHRRVSIWGSVQHRSNSPRCSNSPRDLHRSKRLYPIGPDQGELEIVLGVTALAGFKSRILRHADQQQRQLHKITVTGGPLSGPGSISVCPRRAVDGRSEPGDQAELWTRNATAGEPRLLPEKRQLRLAVGTPGRTRPRDGPGPTA